MQEVSKKYNQNRPSFVIHPYNQCVVLFCDKIFKI